MPMNNHTPGPWRWQGEDYRGGWGWQVLVGPEGEGIICGAGEDGKPYEHLRAYMPIDPKYCKTGMYRESDSVPSVHVRLPDARLIRTAPDMLEELRRVEAYLSAQYDGQPIGPPAILGSVRAVIARAMNCEPGDGEDGEEDDK
jgi:hypothetical protein